MADVFESPHDTVPLQSPFYVNRSPIEEQACTALAQPGGLVRIRAAEGMGKASMLLRIVAFAKAQDFHVVHLDPYSLDQRCCEDGDRFLRWLCCAMTYQLKLTSKLDQYWDDGVGSKLSCTAYLDEYVLAEVESPVVLIFSDVDELLNYPEVAQTLFPMLRFWHEQAKYTDNFRHLRILLSEATESYVQLDVNQSPFNVGLTFQLAPFTTEQVHDLALRYGLDWQLSSHSHLLTTLTGGHPYLVRIALDYFRHQQQSLVLCQQDEGFVDSDPLVSEVWACEPSAETIREVTERLLRVGIYDKHLRGHYATLQKYPELADIMKTLVMLPPGIGLDILSIHSHHLHNLGLVTIQGDRVFPACDLYRHYFRQQFQLDDEGFTLSPPDPALQCFWQDPHLPAAETCGPILTPSLASPQGTLIAELEAENRQLRTLIHQDDLTRISNRRYFDKMLTALWRQVSTLDEPLALILVDIDYFKQYNDTYGHPAGDRCLYEVAQALQTVTDQTVPARPTQWIETLTGRQQADSTETRTPVVARYGGEEFAIILPQCPPLQAQALSEAIRLAVHQLNIEHRTSSLSCQRVTVSMGIASMLPMGSHNPSILVMAADDALYRAKSAGRDRATLYLPHWR